MFWRMLPALALASLALVAVALPFMLESYRVLQFTIAISYAIAVLGLNIVTGYSGQISLAQGAFFGIGAYTTAVLITQHGWHYLEAIPASAALTFVFGVLFGIPALRIRGLNLAIVTVALAVSLRPFLEKWEGLTGGKNGIIFDSPTAPDWTRLDDRTYLYFLSLVIAVALFVGARGLLRGRIGRAMITMRDNETVAETMGIDAARLKILSFGFAALYAGIAGSLFALVSGVVTSDSFPLLLSVAFLAAVVVGGVATVTGAIFGALFVEFMPDYASRVNPGLSPVIYGVALILCMLLMPAGVVGTGSAALRRLRVGRRSSGSSGAARHAAGDDRRVQPPARAGSESPDDDKVPPPTQTGFTGGSAVKAVPLPLKEG